MDETPRKNLPGAATKASPHAPGTDDGTGRQIAVALQHLKGEIPTVVASGRGHIAEKILAIAFANGIKVRQDADLAEVLAAIELDCPIPINCFEAIAEILRYLYQVSQPAEESSP